MENVFKERFKNLRKSRNMNQSEIGEIFDISQMQISKYEIGDSYPPAETLIKMAKYFNVTTDYLLGLSNYSLSNYKELRKAHAELREALAENKSLKQYLNNWKEAIKNV